MENCLTFVRRYPHPFFLICNFLAVRRYLSDHSSRNFSRSRNQFWLQFHVISYYNFQANHEVPHKNNWFYVWIWWVPMRWWYGRGKLVRHKMQNLKLTLGLKDDKGEMGGVTRRLCKMYRFRCSFHFFRFCLSWIQIEDCNTNLKLSLNICFSNSIILFAVRWRSPLSN